MNRIDSVPGLGGRGRATDSAERMRLGLHGGVGS
ncbi:hypothetical protein M2367_003213 [Aeromonas sp. BIGb0445]|jgi:hypothetical protein|nr:hypothetical protein [Aeromonas sp. BIGb0445]